MMNTQESTTSQPMMETLEARECFSATVAPGFMGGVRVAVGDVNGDGVAVQVAMGDGSVRFLHDTINL